MEWVDLAHGQLRIFRNSGVYLGGFLSLEACKRTGIEYVLVRMTRAAQTPNFWPMTTLQGRVEIWRFGWTACCPALSLLVYLLHAQQQVSSGMSNLWPIAPYVTIEYCGYRLV